MATVHQHRSPTPDAPVPPAGSPEELQCFTHLQERLGPLFGRVFSDPHAAQTVVVVPSLSMDEDELAKLVGAHHYEERLLCLLLLLRQPRTHVVYVTSQPIASTIIDYYLQLLPGVPLSHARQRLTLLCCYDASSTALTHKILQRPRLVQRIREAIPDPQSAHMTCFNGTPMERTLAVRLNIPLYACDPALAHLGTKSGSRDVFRQASVPMPDGFEHLRDAHDVVHALATLKRRQPLLRRAVVKLNDGFSGEGNAVFSFAGAPAHTDLGRWVENELPGRLRFEAPSETWERFRHKFAQMGGIVECFMDGEEKRSPSVQCRVDPLGNARIISTHDQVLGGPSGQIFLGCTFPADEAYCHDIHDAGHRIATVLAQQGVLGRFGIDFLSTKNGNRWEHAAIEINLRKGGTTHPYLMLQFLTDGTYDCEQGMYHTPTGQPCFYYASDNLHSPSYCGLTPDDLIDIAVSHHLHFHGATQQGVVFHLIGALSQYGKLGMVGIGHSRASAAAMYRNTVAVLDRETSA